MENEVVEEETEVAEEETEVAEEENFVLVSKVRSGLKREFQFALKSQNEISSLLTGRRARKIPATAYSVLQKKKKNDKVISSIRSHKLAESEDDESESVVVNVMSDDDCNKHQIADSQTRVNGAENESVLEDEVNAGNDASKLVLEKINGNVDAKKVPTKLKELLQTGLLEGLCVKYIRGAKKVTSDEGLAGTIRGCGLLCFCDNCKGTQVVTPNQFELHAGSSNKRPADYIYLENGRSLRSVILECKNASPKSLKVTIQNAINSSVEKCIGLCVECKDPISDGSIGKKTELCISCSQFKASNTKPIQGGVNTNKRFVEGVSLQKASYNTSNNSLQSPKSQGKITRKDLRLHKLVFQDDFVPDGTELGYYVQGEKLLSGYKQGSGIFCYCCQTEISPSQFEAHAGFASRRKPYLNIYTSNGVSLHELSLTLSRTSQFSTDENDDLCSVCHELGDLLCCDGCPRAFHLECLALPSIPQNKWYCNYCEDMFQKEKFAERNPNAIAAGRVPGVDPIEQITNRRIRIIEILDSQDCSGCALCRVHDFCKSGFGLRTVIICDQVFLACSMIVVDIITKNFETRGKWCFLQCEKEYHVGCLKVHKMQHLQELPVGDWFCCPDCERINCTLKEAVEAGKKMLPDYLMNVVKKKIIEKDSNASNLDVTWRVLNGRKSCLDDIRSMLSKAVSVFHEQFDPIFYGEFKQDLIPHMVYGRNSKEKEFGGMYCAVISVNSIIVSCAVFRVFGKEVVEVPLVATTKDCEGKGYFQCLYSCMERLFEKLGVKNMVLPAAEETRSLWMKKFGFNVMPQEELNDLRRRYALMNFAGTSVLQKLVPNLSY